MYSEFCVVISAAISAYNWCSIRLYLQLFVGGLMSYLRYLCLFTYCGIQHILRCALFFCVYVASFSGLESPFLIVHSVFSDVYLQYQYIICFYNKYHIRQYAFQHLKECKLINIWTLRIFFRVNLWSKFIQIKTNIALWRIGYPIN